MGFQPEFWTEEANTLFEMFSNKPVLMKPIAEEKTHESTADTSKTQRAIKIAELKAEKKRAAEKAEKSVLLRKLRKACC